MTEHGIMPNEIQVRHPCRFCCSFIAVFNSTGCDGQPVSFDPSCEKGKQEFCDWRRCDEYEEVAGV